MEDIIVQSFETHRIEKSAVVVYGKVYTYVLVTHTVEKKNFIYISIENEWYI